MTADRLNLGPFVDYSFTVNNDVYRVDDNRGKWEHGCREAARRAVWKSLEKERTRDGKPYGWGNAGINKQDTLALYDMKNKLDQGILRKVVLGGVWPNHRRHLCNATRDPLCEHCKVEENLEHLWWRCPHYDASRTDVDVDDLLLNAPQCTLRYGIQADGKQYDVKRIQDLMLRIFKLRFAGTHRAQRDTEVDYLDEEQEQELHEGGEEQ